MIVKSGGADVEVKNLSIDALTGGFDPNFPWTLAGDGIDLFSGNAPLNRALGLPALFGVLMRLATGVGMLPQKVYTGDQLDREVAVGSWQYGLIHTGKGAEMTPFNRNADIALSLAGTGYCCIRKFKARGKVIDLIPLDSAKVTPMRRGGRLVFEDRTAEDGKAVMRDRSDIIYVRWPAIAGGVVGISPITQARLAWTTGLHRQAFERGWYTRNAEPRVVLSFPQQMPRDEAKEWKELWNDEHQGAENMHGTSVIGGGATVTTIPISLVDAQFIQANHWTADQIGFIYGMPKVFMNTVERPTITEEDWRYLVTFGFGPITTAIDQAFSADPDLFPGDEPMHVETVNDAFLKPDIQKRYEAYKTARQAGWLTANEIRALENKPPLPGGDVMQVTPVGGAVDNTGTAADAAKAIELLDELFKDGTDEQRGIIDAAKTRSRR
jgi:HK97 family phage portal protein